MALIQGTELQLTGARHQALKALDRRSPWMWASGHNGDIRRAAHGYEQAREAAMAAFAKSWRRG
jgi:hypothetical protein